MKFFDYPLGAQDALAWLRRRRKSDILTKAFICQLHHQMFGKVWKWSGEFRRTNKNIGIEWPYISINLRQLLDDVRVWIGECTLKCVSKEVSNFKKLTVYGKTII
jgi:fido (protein-threonine AMPylation protein)